MLHPFANSTGDSHVPRKSIAPIFPEMTGEQQQRVIEVIAGVLAQY